MFDSGKSSGVENRAKNLAFFDPPPPKRIRISGWRGEWTNLNI